MTNPCPPADTGLVSQPGRTMTARPGYICLLISGLSDTHLPILILPLSSKPFLPLVLQRRIAHSISSLDGHSVYKVHRASVTNPHRPAMTVNLCRMVKRVEMRLNLRRIKLRIPSPDRALLARAGGLIESRPLLAAQKCSGHVKKNTVTRLGR